MGTKHVFDSVPSGSALWKAEVIKLQSVLNSRISLKKGLNLDLGFPI